MLLCCLMQESDKLCCPLPIGYLAYSSLSQNTTLSLKDKKELFT
jgi:hypothetical protein